MDVNSLELERAGDSLTGSILVASRLFDGTCNEKIVILVNYHSREFIYGLALNKQATNVDELALFYNLQLEPSDKTKLIDKPVCFGEPTHRRQTVTILHENTPDANFIFTEHITDTLCASKSSDAFQAIADDVFPTCDYKIFLGHMMWTEKQIFKLLKYGFFFRLPPDDDLCLRTPADKCYDTCLNKFNFDLNSLNLGALPENFESLRRTTGAGKPESTKYKAFLDLNDS